MVNLPDMGEAPEFQNEVWLNSDGPVTLAAQRFWPTTYLIDKHGRIRYQHVGEFTRGADLAAVAAIEALMAEPDPVE